VIFRRGLRARREHSLVVHTVNGSSIRGVLIGDYADVVVLAAASLLRGTETPAPIAGEVIILREQIDFAQDVTGVDPAPIRILPEPR
jgi:hypothetical protein